MGGTARSLSEGWHTVQSSYTKIFFFFFVVECTSNPRLYTTYFRNSLYCGHFLDYREVCFCFCCFCFVLFSFLFFLFVYFVCLKGTSHWDG